MQDENCILFLKELASFKINIKEDYDFTTDDDDNDVTFSNLVDYFLNDVHGSAFEHAEFYGQIKDHIIAIRAIKILHDMNMGEEFSLNDDDIYTLENLHEYDTLFGRN